MKKIVDHIASVYYNYNYLSAATPRWNAVRDAKRNVYEQIKLSFHNQLGSCSDHFESKLIESPETLRVTSFLH